MLSSPQQVYEFGTFRLDEAERLLTRDGQPVALTDKVFDLLWLFVQNRGRALGKLELMSKLWPDTVVEENNLTVNISTLRKALGESASEHRYIQTLARRGYRFVAPVRVAEANVPEGLDLLEPTFVGRERELERLAQLLGRAVAGHGCVVFVTGEPGMGKTELCAQFLSRARAGHEALRAATGRCLEQSGTGEAYLPFLEALGGLLRGPDGRRVSELLLRHAPSWCSHFASLQAQQEELAAVQSEARGANSARMLREMGDGLAALSAEHPVVLLLEDVHWADQSSCDLLRLLAQRAAGWRLLIVATLRADEIEPRNHPLKNIRRELSAHGECEELALPLLDPAGVARYLEARFSPHDLPAGLAATITGASEGLPLFVTRLVQLLVERGDIAESEGRWHLTRPVAELERAIPDGVRGLIERKLESLDEPDQRALQAASVLGAEFRSATLASVLGVDEVSLDERLDQLARRHRLVELLEEERLPDRRITLLYRFAHVLYRDVLYQSLANQRRRLLHRQAAEALLAEQVEEVGRGAAQLAAHFEAAGEYERAIRQLKNAAENAGRLHANREAKQAYEHALGLVKGLPASDQIAENVLLYYDLAWATVNVDDAAGSVREFEALLQAASSPHFTADSAEAERARATVFDYLARPWRDAFGSFDMPRMPNQERSRGAVAIQCEAYCGLCYVLLVTGRVDEMGRRVQEFLELARASHNEPRRVEALAWMATRQLVLGDVDRARALLEQCIPAALALDHSRALFVAYNASRRLHFHLAEYEAAERSTNLALALNVEAAGRVDGLLGLGLIRAHLGLLSAGLEALSEAAAIARRAEYDDSLQALCNALGWIFLEAGDVERAVAQSLQGSELASKRGLASGQVHSSSQLACAHLARGDVLAARATLDRAKTPATPARSGGHGGAAAHDRAWLHWQAADAECSLASGAQQAALASAAALLAAATSQKAIKHIVIAHELLARSELALGLPERARLELQAAFALLREHPMPLTAWRVFATFGSERASSGDLAASCAAFERALALIEELGRGITEEALRASWLGSPGVRGVRAALAVARDR
jgi:DNA-binding winged helix-turn-helix (wHTH) protein/tetratricopeptide (TPR) repeat protein